MSAFLFLPIDFHPLLLPSSSLISLAATFVEFCSACYIYSIFQTPLSPSATAIFPIPLKRTFWQSRGTPSARSSVPCLTWPLLFLPKQGSTHPSQHTSLGSSYARSAGCSDSPLPAVPAATSPQGRPSSHGRASCGGA